MAIDIYSHHISKSVGKMMDRAKYYGEGKEFPYPVQNTEPEVRLALMAKYGIETQAISQTAPVLLGMSTEDATEVCRLSNTDNFSLCKAYPDKFVNIAIFSLLDVQSAIDELDRAINELDCRGITLATNQNGKGLDSPEYFPFYEKVVEHDLPILLHGTHWECPEIMDMEHSWRFLHVFGWDYDATQAVWRLIFGGVLDRFPTMKIVTHHLGNYFPFFVRRVEQNFNKFLSDQLPKHISEYWGNIYGDTAVDGSPGAFPCGYSFFGADRMLYGSDYPFGAEAGEDFIRENLAGVKAMYIPDAEKEKILRLNARKLLKIGN
ncbi:MAG: amidohydrolase family protein [Spirochaetales bacterium]|nr:amidohydrolase family protein [Spirochaetales bacterium]